MLARERERENNLQTNRGRERVRSRENHASDRWTHTHTHTHMDTTKMAERETLMRGGVTLSILRGGAREETKTIT